MKVEAYFSNIGAVTGKLTNGCNLKCSYCNVEAMSSNTPRMPFSTAQRILDLLITKSRHSSVSFEFHGGEPLLMGDEWLTKVFRYAKNLAAEFNKEIDIPMVTNGTLLTLEKARMYHELGVRLIVSCDGPTHINDLVRQGGEKLEKNLRDIIEAGIPIAIMTVISPSNYDKIPEMFDWFYEIGLEDTVCNFSQPQGRGVDDALLTPGQKLSSKIAIIEYMDQTNLNFVDLDTLRIVRRFVQGRKDQGQKTCWSFNCQAGHSYVSIDEHGNIHACGSDVSSHVLGNVFNDIDSDLFKSRMFRLHDQGDWALRCFNCPAAKICNHSCATADYNLAAVKKQECEYTQHLWNYMSQNRELINSLSERAHIKVENLI